MVVVDARRTKSSGCVAMDVASLQSGVRAIPARNHRRYGWSIACTREQNACLQLFLSDTAVADHYVSYQYCFRSNVWF